jgi:hypothetical protein
MKLDVRTPIGAMFALDGAVLAIYGLAVDQPAAALAKTGGNITLVWGVVMLVFGGAMLGWAIKDRQTD